MDSIKIIIERFESFIKRSLMPSASFLMLYMVFDILCNNSKFLDFLNNEAHSTLLLIVLFIVFSGLSTLLTILHQFFYDNRLKENFDGNTFFNSENEALGEMRKKVMRILKIEKSNDYLLYQIIGKKMKNLKKDINTGRYIDDIKTIGIFFISFIIVLSVSILHYIYTTENSIFLEVVIFISLVISIYLIYHLGKELIKSKYRSRAIRIYTNYLDEVEEE